MKEIMLTQNKKALVDAKDFEWLSQWKWGVGTDRGTQYAIRKIRRDGKRTTITMHQMILNTPTGMVSDHVNGNGLDNRRSNLRVCSYSNNAMNRKAQKGTSKYKGVSLHSIGGKWKSRIKTKGKIYNLGHFGTEEEAAKRYDEAAVQIFGEYAKLNNVHG